MTLEELIKKYERKAKESRQIANNLAELQRYRVGEHSCEFCRYAIKSENQEPCYSCSHRYKDNFRPKESEQMTREECIKMLKSKLDGNTDTSYEWCECVRLAIKALEQQPRNNLAESSQDCISREAVIRLVEQYPDIMGTLATRNTEL